MKYIISFFLFIAAWNVQAQMSHPNAIRVIHSSDNKVAQFKGELFPIEVNREGYYVIRPLPAFLNSYEIYVVVSTPVATTKKRFLKKIFGK